MFSVLRSETLFTLGSELLVAEGSDYHDIGPDDERFLMLRLAGLASDAGGDTRFILVLNWFEELRERMGN